MALPPRLVVALLWAGALVALLGLWLGRPTAPPPPTGPVRRAADGPRPAGAAGAGEALRAGAVAPSPATHRLDPRGTARSAATGPASPVVAFRAPLGARVTAQAVADAEGGLYVGDHAGTLHALGPDGRRRWARALGGPIWATALVLGDRLIAGSDAGDLVAFDLDGGERWRARLGGEIDTGVRATADGRELRVVAGRVLHAIDAATGRVRWRFEADEKIFTTPALAADGTAVVGAQDDRVYAVGPDGALRWSHRTRGDVDGSPLLGDDGTVYAGSDDRSVHAIAPDGTRRWAVDLGGYVRAPLALGRHGEVLAAVYGPRPRVVALDAADGRHRWSFRVTLADSAETGIASGPVVDAAGDVYFGAHDDFVYGITAEGALRWVVPTGGDVDAAPLLLPDGTLVVGSEDGFLYGLRPGGG